MWASYLVPTPYHSERTPNPKVWNESPSLPLQELTSLYPPAPQCLIVKGCRQELGQANAEEEAMGARALTDE